MKPPELKTKIFLDSFSPEDTKRVLSVLGFLDGQTTNPNQVSKDPYAEERFLKGNKFTKEEILDFYKKNIKEISTLVPNGPVSIEVYADEKTTVDEMFLQAKEMFGWISNAQIKYPIIPAGLEAAERSIKEGMRVNMTLCFSEEQAAAVYSATKGAKKGDVFVSPFVGRLDDIGENGMSLIKNILETYKAGDGHVEVLVSSVRTIGQLMASFALQVDIITASANVLIEWGKRGMPIPDEKYVYDSSLLKNIPYKGISLDKPWREYDIHHDMTDKGLNQFVTNWNALLK